MTHPRQGARLYPQDLDAIHGLARAGFIAADQFRRHFYATSSEATTTHRLAQLAREGFVSRTPSFAHSTPYSIGRPIYVYYWTPPNHTRLRTYLEERGHASTWHTTFAHLAPLNNHEERFSQQYLAHETGIIEYFLCLERDAPRYGWAVPFWERTSPFSKELRAASGLTYGKLTVTEEVRRQQHHQTSTETKESRVSFNPDGLYCLKSPDSRYELAFHEEDNNTSGPRIFREKLMAYKALDEQGYFARIRAYYITKYQLPADQVSKGFRVTTATPDAARRDALFLDSLRLKAYKRFLFASMEDISPTTAFGAIWIRGKEYAPIRQQLAALPPEIAPAIYTRTRAQLLDSMPRVSLATAEPGGDVPWPGYRNSADRLP